MDRVETLGQNLVAGGGELRPPLRIGLVRQSHGDLAVPDGVAIHGDLRRGLEPGELLGLPPSPQPDQPIHPEVGQVAKPPALLTRGAIERLPESGNHLQLEQAPVALLDGLQVELAL